MKLLDKAMTWVELNPSRVITISTIVVWTTLFLSVYDAMTRPC